MAQINWNNIAAPSLGESNSLFTQAIQSLKDAGIGLKDTAKDYQTVVRNRSHAILQDYINSAKTPEELQSEAFNTGFKNLQATLANEYDAVKVNDYRDSAVDKLTRRAGDAVALKRNTLGLATDQQAVDTNDMMNRIFTAPEAERPALIAEAVKLNRFDAKAMLTNQVNNAQLTQATNANDLFKVQKPFLEVQPKLANEASEQSTKASKASVTNAAAELVLRAREVSIKEADAKAERERKANGGDVPYAERENGILDELNKGLTIARKNAQEYDKSKHPYASEGDWQNKEFKDPKGKNYQWLGSTSAPSRYITDYAKTLESFNKLPKYIQASVLDNATDASRVNDNVFDSQLWYLSEDNKTKLKQYVDSAIKANTLTQQNSLIEETAAKQLAVTKLMRVRGYDEQTAKNIVEMEINRVPKSKEPDKKDLPSTEQERSVNEIRKQKLTPSAMLIDAAKNRGGLNGNKPAAATSSGTPRSSLKLTPQEEARLAMLSDYATLKEKLSASTPNPENTLAFQKATAGLDLENAKLGKLDSLTADRYVADIQAKLQRKNLDPLARAQQERLLKIFQANQKNFKGGD